MHGVATAPHVAKWEKLALVYGERVMSKRVAMRSSGSTLMRTVGRSVLYISRVYRRAVNTHRASCDASTPQICGEAMWRVLVGRMKPSDPNETDGVPVRRYTNRQVVKHRCEGVIEVNEVRDRPGNLRFHMGHRQQLTPVSCHKSVYQQEDPIINKALDGDTMTLNVVGSR